jgi:hypothetical protein
VQQDYLNCGPRAYRPTESSSGTFFSGTSSALQKRTQRITIFYAAMKTVVIFYLRGEYYGGVRRLVVVIIRRVDVLHSGL